MQHVLSSNKFVVVLSAATWASYLLTQLIDFFFYYIDCLSQGCQIRGFPGASLHVESFAEDRIQFPIYLSTFIYTSIII